MVSLFLWRERAKRAARVREGERERGREGEREHAARSRFGLEHEKILRQIRAAE